MNIYYSAISCVGIFALLILDYLIKNSDLIVDVNKRFFRLSVWTVLVVMGSEMATVFFEGAAVRYRTFHVLGNVLGFALSPYIPLLIGCAIGTPRRKYLICFGLPAGVNLVLSVLSAWFPIIFWVDQGNAYLRGGGFWMYVLSYAVAMVFLLLQALSITRHYQNNCHRLPMILFCFVMMGTTVQVAAAWLHLSWLCISFALILFYVYDCNLLHQIDGLTGLLNRRTFEYNIHKMGRRSQFAVFMFDLDDFKHINDVYGHPFGDHALIAVSGCIRKVFFKIGLCFRIGGDEFCVITRKTSRAVAEKAYKRFLHEVQTMRKTDSRLPLVSVGYAYANDRSENVSTVLSRADQSMYQLKRQRKEHAKQ